MTLTIDSSTGGASMQGGSSVVLQSSPQREITFGTHSYENKAVVTIRAHWNSGGYGVPQPPPKVCAVKVAASGQAWGQSLVTGKTVSVSGAELNDGFYDSPVSCSTDGHVGVTESGLHLIQMNGTGADRAKSFNLSAKLTMTNTDIAQYICQIGFSVYSDSRAVSITSSRDATYHREMTPLPTAVPNVSDENGAIHADVRGGMLLPDTITYSGSLAGDWTPQMSDTQAASWAWKSSIKGVGAFGYLWNPPAIGTFKIGRAHV